MDDTAAFNLASEHAFKYRGILVASGVFRLAGTVNIFSDCDLSCARIIVDGGKFLVTYYDSELSELVLESKSGHFDPVALTYLKNSLHGVLSAEILQDFANSFVRIDSNDIHIYRMDGDDQVVVPLPQLKSTVTLMNEYGRLSYSLMHDFVPITDTTNVKITLRRLPNRRLRFIAPEFTIMRVGTNSSVLDIRRDLTDVIGFTCTRNVPATKANEYDGLVRCGPCYDVTIRGASFPGYGVLSNEPGIASEVRYDCLLSGVLKLRCDSMNSSTGWKTIDGNNFRDVVVSNCVVDGFHGHYNVADVLVTGSTILDRGLSFGTGSADSTITVRDCKFIARSGTPLAMRADYGELRGAFVIDNCIFDLRDGAGGTGMRHVLSLVDNAIRRHNQPNTYGLPSKIHITNISIMSLGPCNLIAFNANNDVYGPDRRLTAPRIVLLDGVDATHVDGALNFRYGFIPYDADTCEPVDIRITHVTTKGPAFPFVVTFPATLVIQDKLHYRTRISDVDGLRALFMGSGRTDVRIESSTASSLDTYDGGSSRLRSFAIDGVTLTFDANANVNNDLSIGTEIQRTSVVNCVFDGAHYKQKHGVALLVNTRAHHTSGNIAIDCGGTGADGYDPNGKRPVVPKVGEPLNYKHVWPSGLLQPTWPV